MAFFKCGGGSGTKVYSLGTGTASGNNVVYDIKTLLPDLDYTKLTNNNFIVKISQCSSYSEGKDGVLIGNNISASCSPTTSYDNSTGVLTVSGLVGTNSRSQSGYWTNAKATATVGGCYLIDGDIES